MSMAMENASMIFERPICGKKIKFEIFFHPLHIKLYGQFNYGILQQIIHELKTYLNDEEIYFLESENNKKTIREISPIDKGFLTFCYNNLEKDPFLTIEIISLATLSYFKMGENKIIKYKPKYNYENGHLTEVNVYTQNYTK